jgi:hypothetical protein
VSDDEARELLALLARYFEKHVRESLPERHSDLLDRCEKVALQ